MRIGHVQGVLGNIDFCIPMTLVYIKGMIKCCSLMFLVISLINLKMAVIILSIFYSSFFLNKRVEEKISLRSIPWVNYDICLCWSSIYCVKCYGTQYRYKHRCPHKAEVSMLVL